MTEAIPTAAGAHKKRLLIVFALTGAYMIAEVVGGLLTHSLALMADAGHMVTAVAGIGLALLAIRFAERPATPEKTYGHYRPAIARSRSITRRNEQSRRTANGL